MRRSVNPRKGLETVLCLLHKSIQWACKRPQLILSSSCKDNTILFESEGGSGVLRGRGHPGGVWWLSNEQAFFHDETQESQCAKIERMKQACTLQSVSTSVIIVGYLNPQIQFRYFFWIIVFLTPPNKLVMCFTNDSYDCSQTWTVYKQTLLCYL